MQGPEEIMTGQSLFDRVSYLRVFLAFSLFDSYSWARYARAFIRRRRIGTDLFILFFKLLSVRRHVSSMRQTLSCLSAGTGSGTVSCCAHRSHRSPYITGKVKNEIRYGAVISTRRRLFHKNSFQGRSRINLSFLLPIRNFFLASFSCSRKGFV